jgi:hypothetical protein
MPNPINCVNCVELIGYGATFAFGNYYISLKNYPIKTNQKNNVICKKQTLIGPIAAVSF